MQYIYNIIILSMGILFSACSNQPNYDVSYTKVVYPTWYTKPPANTTDNLYGTGQADTIKLAKSRALSNAVSKLYIEVESNYQNTVTASSNLDVQYDVINTIKLKVKNISVLNYNLIEQKEMSFGNFIVLISIDSNKIIDFYNNKIQYIYKKEKMLSNRKQDIYLVVNYHAFLEEIKEGLSYISIIQALQLGYDTTKYYNFMNQNIKYFDSLKHNNSIKIKSFSKYGEFNKKIENIMIKNYSFNLNNTDFKYLILLKENNCSDDYIAGIYIRKCTFNISILDKYNNKIKSDSFSYKGISGSSKENATFNMYKNLSVDDKVFEEIKF